MKNFLQSMRFQRVLLFCFFLSASYSNLFGQSNDPVARSGDFMNVFIKSGFEIFVDSLFTGSKWMGPEKLEKLKLDGKNYFDPKVNGELFGFDLVSTANLNDRLVTITYLVRTDRTPFTFRLTWYRPGEAWKVQNFNFDTNIDDELQEAGKWKMQSWISQN